jgi:flagellar basal-body rod modification protein FlgD
MAVDAVNGTTTTTQTTSSTTNLGKDDFLKILITQLKNQNPLEPMKPDEFMSQLSQLTQVEQLTNIAKTLEEMQTTAKEGDVGQWVAAIGKRMKVETSSISNGDEVTIVPSGDYDKIVLTAKSLATGETTSVAFSKGDSLTFKYDGTDEATIAVSGTKNGKVVLCTSQVFKVVAGIDVSTDKGTMLVASNGQSYTAKEIKQIKE